MGFSAGDRALYGPDGEEDGFPRFGWLYGEYHGTELFFSVDDPVHCPWDDET